MNIATIALSTVLISGVGMTGSEAISFAKDYTNMRKNAIQSLLKGDIEMKSNQALMRKVCIDAVIVLRLQGQPAQIDCKAITSANAE